MRCYLLFPAAVLFCGMVSVILGHTSGLAGARATAVDGAGRRQAEEGVASHFGNPFLFTGREYDAETGLYYYRGRYYSPALGKFINRDPVGYRAGDANLYQYVRDNPLTRTDPTGMATVNPPPPPGGWNLGNIGTWYGTPGPPPTGCQLLNATMGDCVGCCMAAKVTDVALANACGWWSAWYYRLAAGSRCTRCAADCAAKPGP